MFKDFIVKQAYKIMDEHSVFRVVCPECNTYSDYQWTMMNATWECESCKSEFPTHGNVYKIHDRKMTRL